VLGNVGVQILIREIRALDEESLDSLDMNCDILFYNTSYSIYNHNILKGFLLMIDEVERIDDGR
jgi:hypothetical protein